MVKKRIFSKFSRSERIERFFKFKTKFKIYSKAILYLKLNNKWKVGHISNGSEKQTHNQDIIKQTLNFKSDMKNKNCSKLNSINCQKWKWKFDRNRASLKQ